MNNDNIRTKLGIPIESPLYKKFEKVFNYAMDKTKAELKQATEGMMHNLNTLQSRSGKI